MKKLMLATVALTALGLGGAQAVPVTGTINLAGDFQPLNGTTPTQNLNQATAIDFLPPAGGGTGVFRTLGGTGTLATFANLSGGTIQDFSFSPFSGPITTFYTINGPGGTLSFDLSTVAVVNQNANFLTLSGTGFLNQTGFERTPGTFNFSGNSSNGASPQATFSWSASDQAMPATVPEPMSMALLGVGLIGAGLVRRRAT